MGMDVEVDEGAAGGGPDVDAQLRGGDGRAPRRWIEPRHGVQSTQEAEEDAAVRGDDGADGEVNRGQRFTCTCK